MADIIVPEKDDLEKIEDTGVTTVRSLFVAYVKKNYLSTIVLPILLLILAIELTILIRIPHPLFFYVFLLIAYFAFCWQKVMGDFLKKFASEIGYTFSDSADLSSVDATLFDFGHSQSISKVVSGKYFNQDSRLFIFSTTEGSGKNRHTFMYSVLEISFATILPNILLNNRKNWLSSSQFPLAFPDNEVKVSLEGDFQKYFKLYVAKEYEVEALQIFNPEIMQLFIDKADSISAEMYKNKVYLYYPKEISKKDQLLAIYGLAKEIILKLGPTFARMKADVEDMSQYAKLT